MPDFYTKLEAYAATNAAEDRQDISEDLWRRYGSEGAIFILDLSGFSRTANKHGIVHCLSMIQQMRTMLAPLVESRGGAVVKFEADNCFARFPDPLEAIQTAIDCNHLLAGMNEKSPPDFQIHASVGIDYGKFLLIRDTDFYGVPVNIASKLGEDTAEPGEILVTERVLEKIGEEHGLEGKSRTVTISGLDIAAFEVFYQKPV